MAPDGFLSFDLRDVLRCLDEEALGRRWKCSEIECIGEATTELEKLVGTDEEITGERLLALADKTIQVIWGDFRGYRPAEQEPTLRVRAIDSSWWEVLGDDACLAKIRARFLDVRPIIVDAD